MMLGLTVMRSPLLPSRLTFQPLCLVSSMALLLDLRTSSGPLLVLRTSLDKVWFNKS